MKKVLLTLMIFSISIGYSQITLPIDFETTSVTTSDFVDFDGGTGTVGLNPNIGGINTSDSVAQIIRNGGQVWAGSKVTLGGNLDFSTLGALSMKVYTTAPIGTVVKFKLESTGAGTPVEVDVTTTTTGVWDTLTWDFTGTPNNLDILVFMFDFGNTGNGSANSTFYFDDIKQVAAPPSTASTLPIDFETDVNVGAFDNAIGAQVANPFQTGINTSDSVGQLTRPAGGAGNEYAGSRIILANNIDFTTMTGLSMKVYCTEPVGHLVKVKFEGGTPFEADAYTTVTGAWETLTWDFTGQNVTNNEMLFMFNAGTLGAGEVYYFDDIEQIVAPVQAAASLPIDFETDVDVDAFDNAIGAQVANPFQTGINTSDSVGQLTRPAGGTGNEYAGSRIVLTPNIDFSTLPILAMKVYCTEPVGHLIKVKFEGGTPVEVDANTTVSGAWETIYWDFTGMNGGTNNEMLFMFNAGTLGTGEVYYFDDIEQLASIPLPPTDPINLPIDFESDIATEDFMDFDGAIASVVTNTHPTGINTSSKVGQIVRSGGEIWAGSSLTIENPVDFTTLPAISMKVYTDAPIGTTVKFKLESDTSDTEVDVLTTVTGDWETLVWDFSGEPTEYNKLTFMFDFGNVGDGSVSSTFLFDDIEQAAKPDNMFEGASLQLNVYPNPTTNSWFFDGNNENISSIVIFDAVGKVVFEKNIEVKTYNIDATNFASGIYTAKVSTNEATSIIKVIKK